MNRPVPRPSRLRAQVAVASLVLLSVAICGGSARSQPHNSAYAGDTKPKHWRLIWTTDPHERAMIGWTTADAGQNHRVHFDVQSRGGKLSTYAFSVEASRNGRYESSSPDARAFYHFVELTKLQPSTTYYLALSSDNEQSREFHFVTAPVDDREFSIISGGDSRSDPRARCAINRRIAQIVADDREVLALGHGGDYVWSGLDAAEWFEWLSDHELTTTSAGRLVPIIPTRGNHEITGELYDQVFGWPGGGLGRNYFTTRLGPRAVLVTLNTEISYGGEQRDFLEATLREHERVPWKLAQYHRAIYPAVKQTNAGLRYWAPLFDRFGVNVALENDGHALKRSVPIRENQPDPSGVVYIGEGGMGVPQRTPRSGRWWHESPGFARPDHHVWKVRIGADQIALQAILVDGSVRDNTTIQRPMR